MKDTFRIEQKDQPLFIKDTIILIKKVAEELEKSFDSAELNLSVDKRCFALARTNLEQAIMWAIKGIT